MTFTCEICNRDFSLKCNLMQHVKAVHNKINNFKCNICGRSFALKTNLERHIKTVHEKIKDFKCEICSRTFTYKTDLNRHIKAVHEKIKDFACDVCQKSFSLKGELTRHKLLIHENPKESNISRPESAIKTIFEELNINYIKELKFDNLLGLGQRQLRFDFGIQLTDKWLLVEYDGVQHFKPVAFGSMTIEQAIEALKRCQVHDRIKNDFCLLHNYPLLRLSSQHLPNLKEIIIDFVRSQSNLLD